MSSPQLCQGTNMKTRLPCKNRVLSASSGPPSLFCSRHITDQNDSLFTICHALYLTPSGQTKRCQEVTMKRFNFCSRHFELFLNNFQDSNSLNEHFSFLEGEISVLIGRLPQILREDRSQYHREYKRIQKLKSMRHQLNQRIHLLSSSHQGSEAGNLKYISEICSNLKSQECQSDNEDPLFDSEPCSETPKQEDKSESKYSISGEKNSDEIENSTQSKYYEDIVTATSRTSRNKSSSLSSPASLLKIQETSITQKKNNLYTKQLPLLPPLFEHLQLHCQLFNEQKLPKMILPPLQLVESNRTGINTNNDTLFSKECWNHHLGENLFSN